MNEEQKKAKKDKMDFYALSVGGRVTGLLFISAVEAANMSGAEDYFDGIFPASWPAVVDIVFLLCGLALGNAVIYLIGSMLYAMVRAEIGKESRVWNIVFAVVAVLAAVLFCGIVFNSCVKE